MRTEADRSRNPNIESLPFDDEAVHSIGALLDADVQNAPFRMPGSNVWQLTVHGDSGKPGALVTMWTGLHRVDVISGASTIVMSDIQMVDLVPGVEVQFRTSRRSMLIVARNGQVIVRGT